MADPVTGLTARDREMILETWECVGNKEVIRERAVDLFVMLFEAHPYIQDFFVDFKGLSIEELKSSPKLKYQSMRTMSGLQQYMEAINEVPKLVDYINKLAHTHLPRGVKTLDMENLSDAFVAYMRHFAVAKWSDEAEAAWKQLFKVHNSVYKGLEDQQTAGNN